MNILGINCYGHDTSAALLVDGKIAQLHEEERFNRQKHTRLYPYQAVNFCLSMNKGGKDAIDFIAYPFRNDNEARQEMKKIAGDFGSLAGGWLDWRLKHFEELTTKLALAGNQFGLDAPSRMIGHHESHMASAFFSSPFEQAAILSIDGLGDLVTTMFGIGEGTKLHVLKTIQHPHGIGYFYTAITQYLGFSPTSDEGKVMGLAPYGRPRFQKAFAKLLALEPEGGIKLNLDYFWHHNTIQQINPRLAELLGPHRERSAAIEERHEDIAYGAQERSEQAYFHHLKHLFELTKCENLCLAGGVALNSCANGKILEHTPFQNIFIPPFVHDAGTAIGAAQRLYHHKLGNPRIEHKNLAYLGYEPGEGEIKKALTEAGITYQRINDPAKKAASLIAEGKIIAWYQRRSEAGPRALGNRSILADPRRAEMKDLLNARVKFREGFRPFAPTVLLEHVSDYFEYDKPEPFMLQVCPVTEDKREVIPSVTHVDGTGRLQTIASNDNPLFYNLISEFEKLTGVPVVLNTSFNVMGEPIINRPEEAIQCFLKTGIDVLFLDDYLVTK